MSTGYFTQYKYVTLLQLMFITNVKIYIFIHSNLNLFTAFLNEELDDIGETDHPNRLGEECLERLYQHDEY